MHSWIIKFVLLIFCFAYICSNSAQSQTLVKIYGDWSVYTYKGEEGAVCYTISAPKGSSGNYKFRGQPYLMVSLKDGNKEVSTSPGFYYKSKTKPVIIFDNGKEYELFSKGKLAWAYHGEDLEIIKYFQSRYLVKIDGVSTKDTTSIDQYSLKGFSDAYKHIQLLCNK